MSIPLSRVRTGAPQLRGFGRPAVTLILALSTLAIVVTGAIFTDTDTRGSNTLSTGTVDISTGATTAIVSFSNMAPGDTTGPQTVTVTNNGSLELRYAITSTATNADAKNLAGELDLTVWAESSEVGGTVGTCETATAPLYNALALGTTTGTNVVGDPTQGAQTGDRTLSAAASEKLCFKVDLPSTTGNAFQGASTTATFDFKAEQTANNA